LHAEPTLKLLRCKVKNNQPIRNLFIERFIPSVYILLFSLIILQYFELCFQHPDIYIKFAAATIKKKEQKT